MNQYEIGQKQIEVFVIPKNAQIITCIDQLTGFDKVFCACIRNGMPSYVDLHSLRKAYSQIPFIDMIKELEESQFMIRTRVNKINGCINTSYELIK